MTTPTIPSITDEQLAEIERQCEKFAGFAVNSTLVEQLITRLRAAERDAERLDWMMQEQCVIQCQNGTSSPTVFNVYWPSLGESQRYWYATERDAIDAAMTAMQEQKQ